jgi:hypothetical protein
MAFDFNPITGQLDLVTPYGSTYLDGEVEFHADLPSIVGTPATGVAYLVRKSTGVWFVNRKPRGIWERVANVGTLDDWEYIGTYRDVFDDEVFALYNGGSGGDPTKEVRFDLSDISTASKRVLKVPDENGTLVLANGRVSIEATSNTRLVIKYKGTDDIVRGVGLTIA